jgi:hypothetical protein
MFLPPTSIPALALYAKKHAGSAQLTVLLELVIVKGPTTHSPESGILRRRFAMIQ